MRIPSEFRDFVEKTPYLSFDRDTPVGPNGHVRIIVKRQDGKEQIVCCPFSPSDVRAWKNFKSQVRKVWAGAYN